ncbi:MAG: hypothetical protein BWY76_03451 [bacterium ADurb.Bin429]|nr:MAG: hypothetical protein BWY76_03451 [bacterium ADurb.Bin429]
MVENTKVSRPTVRTVGPTYGIISKARFVIAGPIGLSGGNGCDQAPEFTSTRPVIAHTTTVSQKVPVADTSACRTGLRVRAAAATMGADPRPDSLEKRPRAMPKRMAAMMVAPTKPPAAACPVKADLTMSASVAGSVE